MPIEIKSLTGVTLFTVAGESLRDANLRDADLSGANLRDANLRDADLSGANLYVASLRGANLRDADLSGANLRDANLRDANLSGANLYVASLRGTNLRDADLRGADLSGADLRDAIIETGETWEVYLSEVVPQLLGAGGTPVDKGAWECHSWSNCPMAQAFDVDSIAECPILYQPRIEQFIRYFDAGLIPAPEAK